MKTIAVIFGSRSAEHDISIITALSAIIKPLELSGQYTVEAIYIAKDGSWYWDEKLKDVNLFISGEIEEFLKRAPKVQLQFDGGLTLVRSSQFAGRKTYKNIDIVFPATHGTYGEDGSLMGLLEMANVAYVGCDVPSSAIAMDKVLSKQVVSSNAYDVDSTKYEYLSKDTFELNGASIVADLLSTLKLPVFVKPAHLGSSIGISKVENERELINALEVAFHYDNKVIVEEAVQNLIEVTVPVMGRRGQLITGLVERPLLPEEGVFDFSTKYMNQGGKKMGKASKGAQGYSELPAKINQKLYDESIRIAKSVFLSIGCEGIARVDLLIDSKTNKIYFNEINPLPGSLYTHNWRASGISGIDLVTKLVEFAVQRWQEKQKLTTSFSTNFLKQF